MKISQLPIKESDLAATVAENVRAESARRNIKQADLMRYFGTSRGSLSRKWRGVTPWNLHEIDILAELFGVEPVDLIAPYRETKAAQVVNYPSRRAVHRLGLEPRTLWLGVSAGEGVENVIDLDIFKARRAS